MLAIDLFVASNSPRRHELLAQIGVRFATVSVEVDETPEEDETPRALVRRLALAKARAGLAQRPDGHHEPVLGADTLVICDGRIIGKPQDLAHALDIWQHLSGRRHQVMTAVAMVGKGREEVLVQQSEVRFRVLSRAEMLAYWASGEPRDKAGAYAIQGLGAVFVEHLAGSYSGVMGLPLYETSELLGRFGITVIG